MTRTTQRRGGHPACFAVVQRVSDGGAEVGSSNDGASSEGMTRIGSRVRAAACYR